MSSRIGPHHGGRVIEHVRGAWIAFLARLPVQRIGMDHHYSPEERDKLLDDALKRPGLDRAREEGDAAYEEFRGSLRDSELRRSRIERGGEHS